MIYHYFIKNVSCIISICYTIKVANFIYKVRFLLVKKYVNKSDFVNKVCNCNCVTVIAKAQLDPWLNRTRLSKILIG